MRVPVLITMTLTFGTTALLKSVMRPVSDAFVDWARRGTGGDRIIAEASVIAAFTDASERHRVAMREESTTGKISQLSWAPRRSPSYGSSYTSLAKTIEKSVVGQFE